MHRATWLERRFGADIEWMPFELHPEYPPEGIGRAHLEARYGTDFLHHVRSMIEGAGLAYSPPDVVPNSIASLKLAELARDQDLHAAAHVALFDAYWARGRDIGDPEVLIDIGAQVGLPPDLVREATATETYKERIDHSTETAVSLGVTGVPAWVIDRRLLIIGAQPEGVFERILTELGFDRVA